MVVSPGVDAQGTILTRLGISRQRDFGVGTAPLSSAAAVPEPSTLLMAMIASTALCLFRKRSSTV